MPIQVASVLSDLTSLRVCDPAAALNLVSVRPAIDGSSVEAVKQVTAKLAEREDTDLQRAKDMVELHYGVKVKHEEQGLDAELKELRGEVQKIVDAMERGKRR